MYPSCLTPPSVEAGSGRESEHILFVMSIYRRLQTWIVIGVVHTVLSVQAASVRLSGAALRLYIVPMRGEAPHKQELASRWFGSFTHTAPAAVAGAVTSAAARARIYPAGTRKRRKLLQI